MFILSFVTSLPGGGEQTTEIINGEINGTITNEKTVVAAKTENGNHENDAGKSTHL